MANNSNDQNKKPGTVPINVVPAGSHVGASYSTYFKEPFVSVHIPTRREFLMISGLLATGVATTARAQATQAPLVRKNLATLNASHFIPWRPKLTCARASSPAPSSVTITPSPNLV